MSTRTIFVCDVCLLDIEEPEPWFFNLCFTNKAKEIEKYPLEGDHCCGSCAAKLRQAIQQAALQLKMLTHNQRKGVTE